MDETLAISETFPETGIETVRVETALSRFPIHALCGSDVEIHLQNLGTATKWEVTYNSKYGQPGQLAYKIDTLIVNRRIEEESCPIPKIIKLGSLRDIGSEISTKGQSGTQASYVKKALLQNAFAGITAKISYKTKEGILKDIEFSDTRYGVVFTGDKLPDGRKADAVYIILHDFYREILNFAVTRPLDYAYMKALPPLAQRFYEIASYIIFAALHHKNDSCRMRYSEFCKLSTATRYYEFEKVKKQMYKIHRPHVDSGYIGRNISYQKINDEQGKLDWWMVYSPGINAGKQYEEFTSLPKKRQVSSVDPEMQSVLPFIEAPLALEEAGESEETPLSPEAKALTLELMAAGVSKAEAQLLASQHPEECRRQLGFLPYAEVKSTPGAYLAAAIRQGFAPPRAFQEGQNQRVEAERRRKAAEAQAARERADAARRDADVALLDSEMATLEVEAPDAFQAFRAFVQERRETESARLASMPPVVRKRMAARYENDDFRRELFREWQAGRK